LQHHNSHPGTEVGGGEGGGQHKHGEGSTSTVREAQAR
jgi:hypothetical protein